MTNDLSTQRAVRGIPWRTYLQVIAVMVAVEVALHSFIVKEPATTVIGAALWLGAGLFWTRRGGRGGPIAVMVLALFEILATLFLAEEFADDASIATWILVVHIVLVAAALLAAVMNIAEERSGTGRHATSG
ncbi:MAG: hypothetical protein ACRDJ2_15700 [Actinomycetota bacterium]